MSTRNGNLLRVGGALTSELKGASGWARSVRRLVRFAAVAVVGGLVAGVAPAGAASPPIPSEAFPALKAHADGVLDALHHRDFARARTEAAASGNPVLVKLAAWAEYRTPGNPASFGEI